MKKLEKKDSLTEQEEKNIMILQKPKKYFEKLKEDLNKLKRYQYNIIDNIGYKGLKEIEYLFNKISEDDYYEPIETSADFDGKYIAYECRGDRDNNLSLEEYLNIIRPYLRDMINNHKAISEWKIKLIMRINFVSSLDSKKIHTIHTKSDSMEIMSGIETNDIINELFKSFSKRYQEKLETKMKGSNFVFESVDWLYYGLHKISLNKGGSYIDSPKWLTNKGATINLENKDNECFKYAITVALNYEKIGKDAQRISKINPFINNYNWKDIEFPSHSKDIQ